MKILLLHLSDLHISSVDDEGANRLLAVRQAILVDVATPDAVFIALSGDVSNTGSPSEFGAALLYLQELRASLLTAGIPLVEFVSVPGNHDCYLAEAPDTRDFLLGSLQTYLSKPLDYKGANFEAMTSVQIPFYDFEAALSNREPLKGEQRLYDRRLFTVAGQTIAFHCFNTAWLSRRHEIQAELYIPSELLSTGATHAALSIGVFHHPYNWLNSGNYKAFKSFVEENTELSLCGHEHDPSVERIVSAKGPVTDYLHAPAFFDPSVPRNGFLLVRFDFDEKDQAIVEYEWRGTTFKNVSETNNRLQPLYESQSYPFKLTESFVEMIDSIGAGFRHPRCLSPYCEIRLSDLFVYPDLRHHTIDRMIGKTTIKGDIIRGEELADFVIDKKLVLIDGPEASGKSSLCKVLARDFRDRKYLPLLLMGEKLRGNKKEFQVVNTLKEAIKEQYGAAVVDEFLQYERDRKLLLIDDFDDARVARKDQQDLLRHLAARFAMCVVFASEVFQVQDMANANEPSPFHAFEKATIKEFGRFHRNRLIEKWVYFRRDPDEDPLLLDKLVVQTNKTVATLLGRNVLPHHPVTILTLLQLLDSGESTKTVHGSYGYMYEVLIKTALARVDARDVDAKITYISEVGYAMFSNRVTSLTEEELRKVHREYLNHYDLVKDFGKMRADLTNGGIIVESPRGVYRFKYPYILYYSVAKFLSERSDTMRGELHQIVDHLYNDFNANVLIFYMYLRNDTELILYMVSRAKLVYSEYAPCDMDKDVAFVNQLYRSKPQPLELAVGEVRENRDQHNRRQDLEDETRAAHEEVDAQIAYDPALDEAIKLGISFKTLNILGQILRNATGSLPGSVKLDVTRESYALGMRTLRRILDITSNLEVMRQYIGRMIAERTGICDNTELAGKTDQAIVWLSIVSGFGFVKRLSYAVGHGDLSNTYGKILESDSSLATQIIDVAIKLDHFDRVPELELRRLQNKTEKNIYAATILRDLVADHLYLYTLDQQTRQMLGSMWNIKLSQPTLIGTRARKD